MDKLVSFLMEYLNEPLVCDQCKTLNTNKQKQQKELYEKYCILYEKIFDLTKYLIILLDFPNKTQTLLIVDKAEKFFISLKSTS
jgi:hypothetical protein